MKTISLKQVFESVGYTPAPIEASESDVMDEKQARKIINRFAEDDEAFFNFLHSLKPSSYLPTPMQSGHAMGYFKRYVELNHPGIQIPLSPKQQLVITPEETSGKAKARNFIELMHIALDCQKDISYEVSPSSDKAIKMLKHVSIAAKQARDRGLTLSDSQFDQIKNMALPVNSIDQHLGDANYLTNIYSTHFCTKIKTRGNNQPRRSGISGP
jgi:hypothetical protein